VEASAYPEGQDPREVFCAEVANNTSPKPVEREPEGDEQSRGDIGGGEEAPPVTIGDAPPLVDQADFRVEGTTNNVVGVDGFVAGPAPTYAGINTAYTEPLILNTNTEAIQFRTGHAEGLTLRNADEVGMGGIRITAGTPELQFTTQYGRVPPALHASQQVMYDRVKFPAGISMANAFQDSFRFDNGEVKTQADTNMTQSGMLGFPIQYDLTHVSIHPAGTGDDYKREWDNFLSVSPVFTWFRGQNINVVTIPIMIMEERLAAITPQEGQLTPEVIQAIGGNKPLPRFVDMRMNRTEARRIVSAEGFRAEITLPDGYWYPVDNTRTFNFYVVMHGTHYGPIV